MKEVEDIKEKIQDEKNKKIEKRMKEKKDALEIIKMNEIEKKQKLI